MLDSSLFFDRSSYAQLLRQCRDLDDCRRLEASVLGSEHRRDLFLRNLIIEMYGRCGSVRDAKRAFDAIAIPNVFSANILIAAYARAGNLAGARGVFDGMRERNVVTWNEVITAYSHCGMVDEAWMLFQRMPTRDVVSWTAMITAFAIAGDCESARSVFDTMPHRTIVSSNAILTAYVENGSFYEAIDFFDRMKERNLLTWTAIVTALAQSGHLDKAKSFFDRMPQRSSIAWNAVIVGYCREPERLDEARELFDAMPERDCVSCNAMIGIYGDRGDIAQARTIFSQFRGEESVSLSTAMVVAYSHNGHLLEARNVFDRALEKDIVLWNAMLCGYAHNSCLDQARSFLSIMPEYNTATWNILITANARERDVSLAREVFVKMPVEKNVVTWNALLGALSQNGLCQEALRLFRLMDLEGMPFNEVTLVTALDSCMEIKDARILHDCINGKGYGCSVLVGNALVSLYSRCGSLEDVKCAFDSMPNHSISSWNAMIVTYSRSGHIDLAKTMFQQMPQRNILSLNSMVSAYAQNGHSDLAIELKSSQFDEVTLAALVDACASLSDPLEGRLIHREAVTAGLQSDLTVRNSLINMYGKCGSVREAATVMETMTCRDVLTWNAMLTAYCQNSMIPSGLEMLLVMRMEGIEPDTATHSILLSAFSHAGMVEDACAYVAGFAGHLDSEHYMCVVDLLGRAGILDMAWMLIQQAPRQKGDDPLLPWTTLLAACRMHGDGNTGLNAAKNAISLKPCKSSPYILASSTMW